uniref:Rab-GAP TBC domain-containing protein n=1 Tax=Chromera velia CCMP2878 TaxID=1169474 RepID=A0A0G4HUP7_9ALVE|eukprot:Cvel_8695.t1-p1 / transcript=Cvel_8695.t1 / gene=Cvel_8695 / organism=Chromera_velia_CCMP2878 / gene_product=TBC1 domain family member 5 homolog B, putative / transcript_product=TBC1 domain family member 5 homolog B, putative / location=Cvel_scaffold485:41852-49535(-) / protein_length=931 / sequence_SO=supercontig / SO=protein_coding / is_pseudo=false
MQGAPTEEDIACGSAPLSDADADQWLADTKNPQQYAQQLLGGSGGFAKCRRFWWAHFLGCFKGTDPEGWASEVEGLRERYQKLIEKNKVKKTSLTALDPNVFHPLANVAHNPWAVKHESEELMNEIWKDVERTFSERDFFQSEAVRRGMQRVLFTWCKQHSELSYRQGMNEIVGVIFEMIGREQYGGLAFSNPFARIFSGTFEHIEADAFTIFEALMGTGKLKLMFMPAPTPRRTSGVTASGGLPSSSSGGGTSAGGVRSIARKPISAASLGLGGGVGGGGASVPSPLGGGGLGLGPLGNLAGSAGPGGPSGAPEKEKKSGILLRCDDIFSHKLRCLDSALFNHLKREGVEPQLFLLRWVRLLFCREFHLEDSWIVWDCLFADRYLRFLAGQTGETSGGEQTETEPDQQSKDAAQSLPLTDYIAIAMLRFVRQQLLDMDNSGCLRRLLKFPPLESVMPLIIVARETRSSFEAPAPITSVSPPPPTVTPSASTSQQQQPSSAAPANVPNPLTMPSSQGRTNGRASSPLDSEQQQQQSTSAFRGLVEAPAADAASLVAKAGGTEEWEEKTRRTVLGSLGAPLPAETEAEGSSTVPQQNEDTGGVGDLPTVLFNSSSHSSPFESTARPREDPLPSPPMAAPVLQSFTLSNDHFKAPSPQSAPSATAKRIPISVSSVQKPTALAYGKGEEGRGVNGNDKKGSEGKQTDCDGETEEVTRWSAQVASDATFLLRDIREHLKKAKQTPPLASTASATDRGDGGAESTSNRGDSATVDEALLHGVVATLEQWLSNAPPSILPPPKREPGVSPSSASASSEKQQTRPHSGQQQLKGVEPSARADALQSKAASTSSAVSGRGADPLGCPLGSSGGSQAANSNNSNGGKAVQQGESGRRDPRGENSMSGVGVDPPGGLRRPSGTTLVIVEGADGNTQMSEFS